MKDHDENKKTSYLMYWDVSNLYKFTMSHNLPVDSSGCLENTSQFKKLQ